VLVPSAVSMIADRFSAQMRGRAIGLFSMGSVIGGPLGISLGGALLSAATGGRLSHWPLIGTMAPWRAVLMLVGLGGLGAPLLLMTMREPVRAIAPRDHSLASALTYLIRERTVLLPLYLGLALLAIGDYGLTSGNGRYHGVRHCIS
jgi:MFS family permease